MMRFGSYGRLAVGKAACRMMCGMLPALLAAGLLACGDDDSGPANPGPTPPPGEAQQVACTLLAPIDGVEINLNDPLVIRGEGGANPGQIVRVELTVGDEEIAAVDELPFEYTHNFSAEQAAGPLTIRLEVEGDQGATNYAEVRVTATRVDRPDPPVTGTMTDARDSKTYATVTLGDQTWMAENLAYLPRQDFDISWTDPRYYIFSDYDMESNPAYAEAALGMAGVFYNYWAALDGEPSLAEGETRRVQGVCPDGWHLPSQTEWKQLSQYVVDAGMAAIDSLGMVDEEAVAKALASTGDVFQWMIAPDSEGDPSPTWVAVNPEKNNATGFDGRPVGFRACATSEESPDVWMHGLYSAGWWSSTAGTMMGDDFGCVVRMYSDSHRFYTEGSEFNPGVGLSVRCVKDE